MQCLIWSLGVPATSKEELLGTTAAVDLGKLFNQPKAQFPYL